MTHHP